MLTKPPRVSCVHWGHQLGKLAEALQRFRALGSHRVKQEGPHLQLPDCSQLSEAMQVRSLEDRLKVRV